MTPRQTALIHTARRRLGIEEADYRTILRSIGHVESSTDLTNEGFEDVMAYLESRGFGEGSTYWRDQQASRGTRASYRQLHRDHADPKVRDWPLPAIAFRFSDEFTDRLELLTPGQAHNVIEMLKSKAAIANHSGGASPPAAREEREPRKESLLPNPPPGCAQSYEPVREDEIPF